MRSIVTDPKNDYIFVTEFNVLADHLDRLIHQACRTPPPSVIDVAAGLIFDL